MNILKQELKMSYRSWIYFTLGAIAMFVIFASFYNSFKGDAALLDRLLQNFPAEFKAAFGFADVNLSEAEGFFSFIISYVVLIGAIYGMKLGVTLLSEEYRAKTTDFLLTRPILRSRIFLTKLAAILIALTTQFIVLFGICLGAANLIAPAQVSLVIFLLLCGSVLLVQLFFVGIGLLSAAVLTRIKSVMPITLGVVFFFFIIELINQSLLDKNLTYLTPFSYFKGSSILDLQGYDLKYLVINLAVFVIFTAAAGLIYQKKDVHAV